MKNFRALLLALGAIFVSTQLAQANVEELTSKLTVLKDKLGELNGALTGVGEEEEEKTPQEAYVAAQNAVIAEIKNLNTKWETTLQYEAALESRKKLWQDQHAYYKAALNYIEGSDQSTLQNVANDVINWIVVAEAAQLECQSTRPESLKMDIQKYKEEVAPEFVKLMYKLFDTLIGKINASDRSQFRTNLGSKLLAAGNFAKDLKGNYILKTDVDQQLDQAKTMAEEQLTAAITGSAGKSGEAAAKAAKVARTSKIKEKAGRAKAGAAERKAARKAKKEAPAEEEVAYSIVD